jgi:hypothetical protein
MKTFAEQPGEDARAAPVRLLVVQGDERPAVDVSDEPMVMTFPHLLVRELIAFVGLTLALVLLALFADAPLEEIADPTRTPNPAKAPWYFLGLQELLHYYPPVISGVLLPSLLIVSLAVIPYARVNLERVPFVGKRGHEAMWLAALVLTAVFLFTGSEPVWPLIVPIWLVAIAATVIRSRSLAFWIFTWFLVAAVVFTVIGVFFRGPGWALTLPWRDGVFY